MGLCGATIRLPLTPLSTHLEPVVEGALREAGLLA
jgi:4-hydroxy-tetrahydrodipicolinate synthase